MASRLTESQGYAPEITKLERMVEGAMTEASEARRESLVDIQFYHGKQWTPQQRRVLRQRKQPDNVWNLTRLAINGTLGVIKQNPTDPKAYPRTPKDDGAADVATKTLRFVADRQDLNATVVDCAFDYLVPGTCAAIVEGGPGRFNVTVSQIRWEEFFADPYSRRQDFSDATFMGVARWMFADAVAETYPEKKGEIEGAVASTSIVGDGTFEDRPSTTIATFGWSDKAKRRLMVIELYHREGGTWRRCVFIKGAVLEAGDSPYLDEDGRPANPIVAQSCYVDDDNRRAGPARDIRSPQLEVNKRASKFLHLISTRQLQESAPGAGHGTLEEAKKEAAKPDGVIPPGWQIVQTGDMAKGQADLLGHAEALIERFAPNPARVGREAESQSGRASLIRQQAGMTELAVILGGIEDWRLRVYRAMWERCRQFLTAPDYVRITDDQGAPQFLGINQPQMGPPQVVVDPQTGQPAVQTPQVGVENEVGAMDVDIILDAMPDTANVQQEQFNALADLAKLYGPQEVPFDDLLQLSNLTGKQEIIERRKARQKQMAQQGPTPAQRLQMEGAAADIENKRADTALTTAKAQTELLKPRLDLIKALPQPQTPAAGV